MKNSLKLLINTLCIFIVLTFTLSGIYIFKIAKKTNYVSKKEINHTPSSLILDNENNTIKILSKEEKGEIEFSDLPDVFINALISAEDSKFFIHNGMDPARILASLATNIKEKRIAQGASTITQQLVKNIYLTDQKSIERKIKEALISLDLEQNLTKEEIITEYVNNVYFDNTTIGINNASYKFFNKPINQVTLPEAALLAGIVNAPSLYNPINNSNNANKRKNVVLNLMYQHGYIDINQLNYAKKIKVEDLLVSNTQDQITYDYQAYLDVVYSQIKEATGLDPFITPMKVYTYMNAPLQKLVDNIQKGEDTDIVFTDNNQQIGGAVIENNSGHLIAIVGGRNYTGQRIFNRAYNMKKQPASTIKPILSYALAVEYLNYSSQETLEDKEYTYPNSTTLVNNADHTLLGQITLEEALGYSRNTTALITLEKVISKIGLNKVINYLESINLLDTSANNFNYAYGLGAFENGVSPINMASSYSMLASKGIYYQPLTISKIELLDNSNKTYIFEDEGERIISEETSYIISKTLENVIDNNYWGIKEVSVNNTSIAAKTGTSSFDTSTIKKYNLPANASKDIWLCGYSPNYAISIWTGFDIDNDKNYFNSSNDTRTKIAKKIFKKLMSFVTPENRHFNKPKGVEKISIIKGSPSLLPDEYTPSSMITEAYFKSENLPNKTITPQELDYLQDLEITLEGFILNIKNPNKQEKKRLFSYEKVYGNIEYVIRITLPDEDEYEILLEDTEYNFPLFDTGNYTISYYAKYHKLDTFTSSLITTNFYYE